MKRKLVVALICCMSVASLAACGNKAENEEKPSTEQEQVIDEKEEIVEEESQEDVPEVEEDVTVNESGEGVALETTAAISELKTIAEFVEKYPEAEEDGYALVGDGGQISFEMNDLMIYFDVKESDEVDTVYPDGTFDVDREELYPYYNIVNFEVIDFDVEIAKYEGKYETIKDLEAEGWYVNGRVGGLDHTAIMLGHEDYKYQISAEVEKSDSFDSENYQETASDCVIKSIELY